MGEVMHGGELADERWVFTSCPHCERPVQGHTLELRSVYCSTECYLTDQGLRVCSSCSKAQDGETFQPVPGGKSVEHVCEECAATCVRCGVVQDDPQMLDQGGVCRWCEAKHLAKCAWVASPMNSAARRLLEIIEDLAPQVKP